MYRVMMETFCNIAARHPVSTAVLETLNLATGFTGPGRGSEHWRHVLAAGRLSTQCKEDIVAAWALFK